VKPLTIIIKCFGVAAIDLLLNSCALSLSTLLCPLTWLALSDVEVTIGMILIFKVRIATVVRHLNKPQIKTLQKYLHGKVLIRLRSIVGAPSWSLRGCWYLGYLAKFTYCRSNKARIGPSRDFLVSPRCVSHVNKLLANCLLNLRFMNGLDIC
jgi:hypothetical protein